MKIGHGENPGFEKINTDHKLRNNREAIRCTAGMLPASEMPQEQAGRLRHLCRCPRNRASSMARRSMRVHPTLELAQPPGSWFIAPWSLRPPQRRSSAFTVTELLVVIAIIGLLIALLLPAIVRARDLALQIVCASNLRQVGIALQEYSNEYAGQYPLNCTFFYPMGGFRPPGGYRIKGSVTLPAWGLGMLYYDSYSVVQKQMVNPRPGILKPTRQGIAMIFSTQPGDISAVNQMQRSYYNAQGLLKQWNFYAGYCYWVDRGTASDPANPNGPPLGYRPAYDLFAIDNARFGKATRYGCNYYNTNTSHMPAENPQSNPGSLLASDIALMTDPTAKAGLLSDIGVGNELSPLAPASNHVDTSNSNHLPEGVHDLYNDGAVVWNPMSRVKVHYQRNSYYFAW